MSSFGPNGTPKRYTLFDWFLWAAEKPNSFPKWNVDSIQGLHTHEIDVLNEMHEDMLSEEDNEGTDINVWERIRDTTCMLPLELRLPLPLFIHKSLPDPVSRGCNHMRVDIMFPFNIPPLLNKLTNCECYSKKTYEACCTRLMFVIHV